MDNTLKDMGLALLGLAVFTGVAQQRAEHAGVRALRQAAHGGTVSASLRWDGPFGALLGQSSRYRISGRGVVLTDLPFRLRRGPGAWGHIGRLEIDLADATLQGVPVQRLRVEIPNVSVAAFEVLLDEAIIVRAAGEGSAEIAVGEAGLQAFLARKYPQLGGVGITLAPGAAHLAGTISAFGAPTGLDADVQLAIADGRYVNIVPRSIRIGGAPVPAELGAALLTSMNPVLDLEKDLSLGAWLTLTGVEIRRGAIVLTGRMQIPTRQQAPPRGAPVGSNAPPQEYET